MTRDPRSALLDENGALISRTFVHYDPATGDIQSTSHTQIPPDVPGTVVALFTNITFSQAFSGYRVDLASIVDGDDYPTCALVPVEPENPNG